MVEKRRDPPTASAASQSSTTSLTADEALEIERNLDVYAYTLFTAESVGLQRELAELEKRENRMFTLLVAVFGAVIGVLITLLVTLVMHLH